MDDMEKTGLHVFQMLYFKCEFSLFLFVKQKKTFNIKTILPTILFNYLEAVYCFPVD